MSRPGLIKIRCAPAYSAYSPNPVYNINVDRGLNIIRNVTVMQANVEALGHGVMSDYTTLQQAQILGNAPSRGIQGHLGHPGMSENASGKQFFTNRNFRIADDRLLADLEMFDPARASPAFAHDPLEWMMGMAEQHPDQLAMSAVLGMRAVWVMEDGSEEDAYVGDFGEGEEPPYGATTPLPVIRVEAFYNADVVEEGALTHTGLFSVDTPSFYSQELFQFLDEWRARFGVPLEDVPVKAHQFISKYLHSKGVQTVTKPVTTNSVSSKPERKRLAQLDAQADAVSVSGSQSESPPPVDEPEVDDGATKPVETTDDVLGTIASAQAATDEAEDTLAEPEEEDEAAETNVPDQELVARVKVLEQSNQQQHDTLVALANLMNQQAQVIAKLSKRVAALENEDVMTTQLGGVRTLAAARNAATNLRAPTHTDQRLAQYSGEIADSDVDFEKNPEQATLATVLTRQRTLR